MSLGLAVLSAGAVGGSVLDLVGDYEHEVVAFAGSSSSVINPDGLDSGAVHDRKEREGVVSRTNPEAVFDVDYDMLMEATPTTLGDAELGFSYVERALADNHHVVLTNKGPVAERYADLRTLKAESGRTVQFGAAAGGAIPILSTIPDLGASHVTAAHSVLNGAVNFILPRMAVEGLGHEHILAEAQDLGVAEADPTFDIDGIDTVLKFVILTNVLSDGETEYALNDATVERICSVPRTALDLAAEDGRAVRLIGETTADGVHVTPRLIPQGSTLSATGTQSITQLEAKHAGQLNISDRGVGGPETATTVLSDVSRLEQAY